MADIHSLAVNAIWEKGAADAAGLAASVVAGEVSDTELLERKSMIPTWRARDFTGVAIRTPYKWNDIVYKLVQPHDATGNDAWTPDAVPALWAAVSMEGETGTLEAPITAARGTEYIYGLYYRDPEDDKVYLCQRTGEAEGGAVVLQYLPHELAGQEFEEVS